MTKITKVGGVGIPTVDAYPPKLALLRQGLAALTQLAGPEPTGKQAQDIEAVEQAIAARGRLYDYLEAHGGVKKGAKDDIDPAACDLFEQFAVDFAEAANILNDLPREKALPEKIKIKHLGGSVVNKLNAYKGGRGDNIHAILIGITGRDANGGFVKESLAEKSIQLLDNKVRCDSTPLNFVITEDRDGRPLGDRHILKGRSNALEVLQQNEGFILNAVATLDQLMIEGGEISAKKFGTDLFDKILERAIADQMDLAYAPCTSLAARDEDPRNAAILQKACHYRNNDMPTVFNREELLCNYLPAGVRHTMPANDMESGSDPYIALALTRLKLELAHRERDMPSTNSQPVAIVSDGGKGLYILTSEPDQTLYVPAVAGVAVVDTTGAGDNLTAGAFVKATQLANMHRNFEPGVRQHLTDNELTQIAQFAQKVAVLAIGQQGACVDQDRILQLLKADAPVPVTANMVGIERLGARQEVARAV